MFLCCSSQGRFSSLVKEDSRQVSCLSLLQSTEPMTWIVKILQRFNHGLKHFSTAGAKASTTRFFGNYGYSCSILSVPLANFDIIIHQIYETNKVAQAIWYTFFSSHRVDYREKDGQGGFEQRNLLLPRAPVKLDTCGGNQGTPDRVSAQGVSGLPTIHRTIRLT